MCYSSRSQYSIPNIAQVYFVPICNVTPTDVSTCELVRESENESTQKQHKLTHLPVHNVGVLKNVYENPRRLLKFEVFNLHFV